MAARRCCCASRPRVLRTRAQDNLLAVGYNGRDTNLLGNIILKAAGAVNWRGTAAADVEKLWASQPAAAADSSQLQRGWERK